MQEENKFLVKNTFKKVLRILKWPFIIILIAYLVLVAFRVKYFFDKDKTDAAVEKIHNTVLDIEDVMGENLPPDPGIEADKTVQGIDSNENGIRDDVELAIFREYPDSAKTRAVLLQYALTLQMITSINLNTKVATTIAELDSRAYDCIGKIVPVSDMDIEEIETYRNFVEKIHLNNELRHKLKTEFKKNVRSFELKNGCDIDLESLPN